MTSEALIALCNPIETEGDIPVRPGRLRQDSRLVKPGDTFIAIRGLSADGHAWLQQAVEQGAALLIGETPPPAAIGDAAYIRVHSTRDLIGPLAQAFEGDPAKQLATVGVTGTNGKTTVATLVWQALHQMGVRAGLLGTVGKQIGDRYEESGLTTADPVELAADMHKMVRANCKAVVMEVSSHALEQQRTDGIEWTVGAFTNLSHDHLDYHKSMDQYVAAKRRLFESLGSDSKAVINADDAHAGEMIRNCKADVIDFGFEQDAAHRCRLLHSGADGVRLMADDLEIRSPLAGRFNASNVVQALLICDALGYDRKTVAKSLEHCKGAPGRLQSVTKTDEHGRKPAVFVDYAHTPDALENVASTLSLIKKKGEELVILFGCGGDRDRAKRPQMARIAETWGDRIIITSDNPRSEDPEAIIQDIETGLTSSAETISIPSREDAIHYAVRNSTAHSIILIAGKGHETYQEINGERLPFDDRIVARAALDAVQPKQNRPTGEVN